MTQASRRLDYYQILQVAPNAHPEIVRVAYRALLKSLGKHPDLGGDESDAKNIIEAYRTLSDPERRRAYDQWLRAHSAPRAPRASLPAPPDITNWIRFVLGEYREAKDAPFARSFNLVLEGPSLFRPRLYVKAFSLITKANWPTIGVLCRAVDVARPGWMPSTDIVLLVTRHAEGLDAFLETTSGLASPWGWNRLLIAVCAFAPPGIHTRNLLLVPHELRRLRAALRRRPTLVQGAPA